MLISSGFAGFLIDQIWMRALPASEEFDTYTIGFVGCAVMLCAPSPVAWPSTLGFMGLLMSIVRKPVLPRPVQASGPPAESWPSSKVFLSWLTWMSPWLTTHGIVVTTFAFVGSVRSITWIPPPSASGAARRYERVGLLAELDVLVVGACAGAEADVLDELQTLTDTG